MASVIETHPQRQKIIDAILAGQSVRQIASTVTPKVSIMAVQRYRANVVAPTLANAATLSKVLRQNGFDAKPVQDNPEVRDVTRAALAADPILSRISQHQATVDDVLIAAKDAKDARGVASLVSTDLKGLELQARLTGRLDNVTHQTNIAIVIPAGEQHQAAPSVDVVDIEPIR